MNWNFYKILNWFSFFSFILLLFASCGSPKNIIYFQNVPIQNDSSSVVSKYEIRIANNDNLLITVSSKNPQAAAVFNVISVDRSTTTQNLQWQGFLVDQFGNINFPLIGTIHLSGLTKSQAISLLQEKISAFIEDPVVNIRFMNYKVTVLGEVNRPGNYTIEDEKLTVVQSLGLAGDMTIYGNRRNIIVCREVFGEKLFYKVDITSSDIFNSPVYYLQQNDVVYVEPNNAKVRTSTNYTQNSSLGISVISLLLTIILFFKKY